MKKTLLKTIMLVIAATNASCSAPNVANNSKPAGISTNAVSKNIGKIIYSSTYFDKKYYTSTYTYDDSISTLKIFLETSPGIEETRHKWSFDGKQILAYRNDEEKHEHSIVIYDTEGNEIGIINKPQPEIEFMAFHNSNRILFDANNRVEGNPNPETSSYNYDIATKSFKQLAGTGSINSSRPWPELSLDDNFLFISDRQSIYNKVNDSMEQKVLIYTYNINTGEKKLVTDFDGLSLYRLQWSKHDNTKFAAVIGDGDVYVIDSVTKEKTQISTEAKRKAYEIKFSPYSNEILIYSEAGTILYNLDTKTEKTYTESISWTCDKDTFLLNDKDGSIYTTDRNISKRKLFLKPESGFGTDPNVGIEDIFCSGK